MTDPVWYVLSDSDLSQLRVESTVTMGLPIVIIYLIGDVGSVGGDGSSRLIKSGWRGECRAQDRHARVRAGCDANHLRRECGESVGGSSAD